MDIDDIYLMFGELYLNAKPRIRNEYIELIRDAVKNEHYIYFLKNIDQNNWMAIVNMFKSMKHAALYNAIFQIVCKEYTNSEFNVSD